MSSTNSIAATAAPSRRRFGLNVGLRDAGTLFGLLAIVVVFAVLSPNFLTERNLLNILQQSSINACVALGMTLVIIAGGIDLSVGPTAAIAAVVAAVLMAAGAPIVRRDPGSPALRPGGRRPQRRPRRLWRAAALHRDARHAVALPRRWP